MNQIGFLTTQIVTMKRTGKEMKNKNHRNWVMLSLVLQLHQGYNLVIKFVREMSLIELRCK